MKVKLRVETKGQALYESEHELWDADSFGKALAEVWLKVQQRN